MRFFDLVYEGRLDMGGFVGIWVWDFAKELFMEFVGFLPICKGSYNQKKLSLQQKKLMAKTLQIPCFFLTKSQFSNDSILEHQQNQS